jgi:surfeit locus 1 family protein
MKIGKYIFSPNLFSISITIIAVAVFISLSIWQLQRAAYKNQLAVLIHTQNTRTSINLSHETIIWPEARFRIAEVEGEFEPERQIFLDNIVKSGKPGYHVITPFKIKNSEQRILINRGWISTGQDRKYLPTVATPKGVIKITGTLDQPRSKPVLLFTDYLPDFEGNQRWIYVDTNYMSKKWQIPIAAYLLLQTEAKIKDNLSRKWPTYVNKASMHIGYSIQWAAFALISFIGFIAINLRNTTTKESALADDKK